MLRLYYDGWGYVQYYNKIRKSGFAWRWQIFSELQFCDEIYLQVLIICVTSMNPWPE